MAIERKRNIEIYNQLISSNILGQHNADTLSYYTPHIFTTNKILNLDHKEIYWKALDDNFMYCNSFWIKWITQYTSLPKKKNRFFFPSNDRKLWDKITSFHWSTAEWMYFQTFKSVPIRKKAMHQNVRLQKLIKLFG